MLTFDEQTEENLQCGVTSGGGASGGGGGGGGGPASTKKASEVAGAIIDKLQGKAPSRAKAANAIINQLQSQKPRSVGGRAVDKAFAEIRARRIERATATNTTNARRNASVKTAEAGLRTAVTGKSKSQVKREMQAEAKRKKRK